MHGCRSQNRIERKVIDVRLIDADAMMKRLKAWDTNDAIDKALYNFALNRVLEAPTVEPERKDGQWIKTYRNGFGNLIGYCNQCGRSASVDNYCPNCGAKMEEPT